MKIAFIIFTGYASLGLLYAPTFESLTALVFIAASCSPLLLTGRSGAAPMGAPSRMVFWAIVALGILNLGIIVQGLDRPVTDLLSITGVIEISALATARRYEQASASGSPLILALSLWLVFRVGASVDRVSKPRQVIAVLPVLFYTLVSTEKWPLFLAGVFFFSGMLIALPRDYSRRVVLRYLVSLAPFGLIAGGVAMILRGSLFDVPAIGADLAHYVLAPYPALGAWLIEDSRRLCCTFGSLSFAGPLNASGIVTREAGVFGERALVYGRETNIYTVFRYLVQDFSILGPFLIASWLSLAHSGLTMVGSTALARQLAAFTVFAALMSLAVTPFVHNSAALAVLLSLVSTLRPALRFSEQRVADSRISGATI